MIQSRLAEHTVLAVTAHGDPLLHHVAPLGLAGSRSVALVVDLDRSAPSYPGEASLKELVNRGLRRDELIPARNGMAVLANGGIDDDLAWDLITEFGRHWPAVVVRVTPTAVSPVPIVPVVPLLPEPVRPLVPGPAVYQSFSHGERLPGPGLRLPRLSRSKIEALLAGRVDRRWAWVRAFARVWVAPWH